MDTMTLTNRMLAEAAGHKVYVAKDSSEWAYVSSERDWATEYIVVDGMPQFIPDYLHDANAALSLVNIDKFNFELELGMGKWYATLRRHIDDETEFWPDEWRIYRGASADTPAEAICRAFRVWHEAKGDADDRA